MINLLEQAITATTRTERPGSFETRRRRTRCRARLVTDPRRFPPRPPPVRKIETKGRVFLAAPRTRAVTALPEPIPHRAGRAVTTLPCLSPAAFRRPATFEEPGPRLQPAVLHRARPLTLKKRLVHNMQATDCREQYGGC